jgi:transcriptional regulator
MKKITGIEIKIDRLEGKFKMNQEVAKGDQEGVCKISKLLGPKMRTRWLG